MKNEDNKTGNYLHLSVKISESSLGNFNKDKIKKEEEFYINQKTFILLKNNNIIISEESHNKIEDNEKLLFFVRPQGEYIKLENIFHKNSFKLTEDNINSLNYRLWYVIKTYPEENKTDINKINEDNINEDYYLCKNDIIRLGNFKFILREMKLKNYKEDFFTTYKNKNNLKYDIHGINKNNNPVFEFTPKLDFCILEENEKITCSICNQRSCDEKNPIVSLCSCDSYKFKHYECLKKEFSQKLEIIQNKNKTSTNYLLKCHCYNCQTQIPLSFIIEKVNKTYELIDFNKPKDKDYLFFESLEYLTKNGDYEKSFHLMELNNGNITIIIGRDGNKDKIRDNDIKIFDPYVSRGNHAVIEYNEKEGTLLLKKKNLKSEVLIAIKEELKINKNKILLRIGRTSIEACLSNANQIQNKKTIQTKKDYDDEIKKKFEEKQKKLEEEQKKEGQGQKIEGERQNKEEKEKGDNNKDKYTNDDYFNYTGKKY